MTDVREWARTTPPGRDPRHVLAELDYLQMNGDVPFETRSAALEDLVRRGVIDSDVADVVRSAPVGETAKSWASTPRGAAAEAAVHSRLRQTPPGRVTDAPDPGGLLGSALVVVAPVLPLLALAGVLSHLAVMWVATIALLAGAIVLAVSGGRGDVNATVRRGRLSAGRLILLASIAVLSPMATIAMGFADVDASEYFGAFVGYQSMTVVVLFALAAVARRQERGGPRGARR